MTKKREAPATGDKANPQELARSAMKSHRVSSLSLVAQVDVDKTSRGATDLSSTDVREYQQAESADSSNNLVQRSASEDGIVNTVSDMLQNVCSVHPNENSNNKDNQSLAGGPIQFELSMNYSEPKEELEIVRDPTNESIDTAELMLKSQFQQEDSMLNPHTDPFALREGRTLAWKNVNMALRATKRAPERLLLEDCWGEVPKRQLTAVMGASGAGKTSLLNVLAGRLRSNKKIDVQADVRLNNYAVDPTDINVRQFIAFVAQDDSLQSTSTPYEAIRFSAKLRLPRNTSNQELDELTHRMLTELGLLSCKDTFIGGLLIKGVSGGERKRTSVGVELVTKPSMVFLDEPTSGLDSFSAEQCCEVLKKVARAGASVMFTIHQPSSEIFDTFDHLILMNKGRVMYQGPIREISDFFGKRGHPVPNNYNPADWIIDIAQEVPVKELEAAGYFPKDERGMGEAFSAEEKGKDAIGQTIRDSMIGIWDEPPPGAWTQIKMLFRREMTHLRRDWIVSSARIFLLAFMGALIGMIFLDVGNVDKEDRLALQSVFGALMIVLITSMLSAMQIALFTFPDERPIFLREYSTKHYSVFSYIVSHLATELFVVAIQNAVLVTSIYYLVDFRGRYIINYLAAYALSISTTAVAIFGASLTGANTKLAMQMAPLLFSPQLLFSGFFVAPDLIPSWLRWAQMICPLTYGARIMVVEEFEACSAIPSELDNCMDILVSTRSDPDEVWWYWLALVGLFALFRILSLFVLQRSALSFY